MRVWVAGAAGMLGTEVVAALQGRHLDVAASDREVDITDAAAISRYVDSIGRPEWIINCAAWTAVDAAESNESAAFALNADGPGRLADVAARIKARLVHISTDYVFDGKGVAPYLPDAPVAPCSVYGKSKLAGEVAVRKALPEHVIIRTAWLYGAHGPNFVATMLRLMGTREQIGVVADQLGAPTYAADLAHAIGAMLTAQVPLAGTWHFSNQGQTTWYEFACAIQDLGLKAGLLQRPCKVEPLSTAQYPTPATRPAYSVLDTTSFVRDWNVSIPHWRESLERFITVLREKA
jgi:dTDP-4-dehydrorhamnose reductase